jgi:hypothetical protein
MKKITLVLFLSILINQITFAQSNKEQRFVQTVNTLVKAFSMQDSATVAKFIHPEKGVLLLFRQGVFDNLTELNTISFHDEGFPQVLFTQCKGIKALPLKYATLPKFNCENTRWNKKGLFVDTKKTDHLVSSICKTRNKLVPDNIPISTIQQYYKLELMSRRIVLTGNEYDNLIFYLSYIDGRWYLTIFDEVTCDCSA